MIALVYILFSIILPLKMSIKVSLVSATKVIVIRQPTTILDVFPFALVFLVYGLMVQVIFALWKKFHSKTYNYFILVSIVSFMPFITLFFQMYIALFFYFIFITLMGYLVFNAFQFTLKKNGPRIVYKTFKIIFLITNHTTVFLQLLLVIFFTLGINKMLSVLKYMAYSTYYAVLSREVVRNLCQSMAKGTGYYSKEGLPGKGDTDTVCMICSLPFIEEKTFSLRCGHSYHEDCIKGWTIIGQNNSCYYCKEGIDNKIFTQDYWIKSELFIKPMMNALRSLIAFSVVIIGMIYLRLFVISPESEE